MRPVQPTDPGTDITQRAFRQPAGEAVRRRGKRCLTEDGTRGTMP
jgi:hypothetical protein